MNFDPNGGGPFAPPTDAEVVRRNSDAPSKSSTVFKKIGITLLALVALAALIFGAYTLLFKKAPTKVSEVKVGSPSVTAEKPTTSDVPDVTATKSYENGPLGLRLTYPDTWKATPTAESGVRVESPSFAYTSLDKGEVTGVFRLYIRKGARNTDGTIIGRGVAVQPSEKLVYSQPAPDQRKDTLLSLFGLDTKDNFNFFLVAGNFQLNIGDTLGPNYGKERDAFIVCGGFSGADLTDDLAMHSVAISTIPTSNAYKQAIDIVKSLQLR